MQTRLGRLTVHLIRNRPMAVDWHFQSGWVCRYYRIDLGPLRIVVTWQR